MVLSPAELFWVAKADFGKTGLSHKAGVQFVAIYLRITVEKFEKFGL